MANPIYEMYRDLEETISSSAIDAEKFDSGNNSAGTRVRKAMQEVKAVAQLIRKEVQEQKHHGV